MPDSKHNKTKNDQQRPLIKMKDLMAATGLPKSTILHYLNEGLLPPPVKTGPNMAYYDPACVDRIGFIKDVQQKHRLPLAAIKGLLKAWDKGLEVDPLIELKEYLFSHNGPERLDKKAFCKASGLTPDQVDSLIEARLLIPLEDGLFDEGDLVVGRMLKTGRDRGAALEDLLFYPDLAEQIVDQELALRLQYTRQLGYEEDLALTLEMTRSARALRSYVIDRIFQKKIMKMKGLRDGKDE